MVESALARAGDRPLRVVVSEPEAVDDLKAYFKELGRACVVDQIGEEFHLLVASP